MTLAEARDHCEIIASDTEHDMKLSRFIVAAREKVESDSNHALMSQTFALDLDGFPDGDWLYLPIRPIQSISSITYYDDSDAQQTLATSVYGLDTGKRAVYLKNDQSWPNCNGQHNGVTVTFVAGFGNEDNVPRVFIQLMMLLIDQWFVHRGDERFMPTHGAAYMRLLRTVTPRSYLRSNVA